jgi:hypothetical protein
VSGGNRKWFGISMPVSSMIIALLLLQGPGTLTPYSADEVLAAVGKNVREFQERLPDFVCDERITSSTFDSGAIRTMKTVESVFTVIQKRNPVPDSGQPAFTETREITSIDGKEVRKGTAMPKLPFATFGGFSELVGITFSPENQEFHTYTLDKKLDEGRLVVHFAMKDDRQTLARATGSAWIDATSYQVVRLEGNFRIALPELGRLKETVDYGTTAIGDREFWLPLIARSEATDRGTRKTRVFLADYTNCRKFSADIKLVPQ